jgi:hypothetical protein
MGTARRQTTGTRTGAKQRAKAPACWLLVSAKFLDDACEAWVTSARPIAVSD